MTLKDKLKSVFSKDKLFVLRSIAQKSLNFFPPISFFLNLNLLGLIYGTDKIGGHFYTIHYHNHFKKFRYKRIKMLEIGVGGYSNPNAGGESLRMWKKYFLFGKIFGLDIYDKSPHEQRRIKIYKGSQVDEAFLNKISSDIGKFDIIVDDGSHLNEHVIETFKILFPKLKDGGIYAIEDMQTSYWTDFGGDSKDLKNPKTMMNFFKSLTDSLNHKEFEKAYEPNYFDKKIVSMHFYHNLLIIYKNNNDEKSNRKTI